MTRNWKPGIAKVQDEECCRYCGSGQSLDPAHLWPRSLGGSMDTNNIVPLCRTCHTEFDSGSLDILSRLSLEEQLQVVIESGSIERARNHLIGRRRSQADDDTRS